MKALHDIFPGLELCTLQGGAGECWERKMGMRESRLVRVKLYFICFEICNVREQKKGWSLCT